MEEEIIIKIKNLIEENEDMKKQINCYDSQFFGNRCEFNRRFSFFRFARKMLLKHWFKTILFMAIALLIAILCR